MVQLLGLRTFICTALTATALLGVSAVEVSALESTGSQFSASISLDKNKQILVSPEVEPSTPDADVATAPVENETLAPLPSFSNEDGTEENGTREDGTEPSIQLEIQPDDATQNQLGRSPQAPVPSEDAANPSETGEAVEESALLIPQPTEVGDSQGHLNAVTINEINEVHLPDQQGGSIPPSDTTLEIDGGIAEGSTPDHPPSKFGATWLAQPESVGTAHLPVEAHSSPTPPTSIEIPSGYEQISGGVYVPREYLVQTQPPQSPRSPQSIAHSGASFWRNSALPTADGSVHPNVTLSIGQPHSGGQSNVTFGDSLALRYPLPHIVTPSSPYGWRWGRMHRGVDLPTAVGTPVLASLPGQVIFVGWQRGYGYTVILQHRDGSLQTLYAHLSLFQVQPGQWVTAGQVIALSGSTGNVTGPHLHFELRERMDNQWEAVNTNALIAQAQHWFEAGYASIPTIPTWTSSQSTFSYSPYSPQFPSISNSLAIRLVGDELIASNRANTLNPSNRFNPSTEPTGGNRFNEPEPTGLGWNVPLAIPHQLQLRVALAVDASSLDIGSSTHAQMLGMEGQVIGTLPAGTLLNYTPHNLHGGFFIQPTQGGLVYVNGRWYRGKVLIAPRRGGLIAVNWVGMEDYLSSVVGGEMYPSWGMNALKAQAIAI